MSAVSLRPASVPAVTPPQTPSHPQDRRHLRLVEPTARRGLAPTGPFQAWRRRLGVLVVLLALVVLAVQVLNGPPAATAPVMEPASSTTVVVQPGQTLWDIAGEHAPAEVGAAAYARQLSELNGISNGAVDAWQVLRLPTS